MLTQNNANSNLNINSNTKLLQAYLNAVEETPNDIQKYISKCREIDYNSSNISSEIDKLSEQLVASSGDKQKRLAARIQTALVKLMELKDEKIHLSQLLASSIESSQKSVKDSLQCPIPIKIERSVSPSPSIKNSISSHNNFTNNITAKQSAATSNASSETNSASESQDKGTKRARKTRIDNLEMDDDDEPMPIVSKSSNQTAQMSSNANKRASNANAANNKKANKKRKATKKQTSAQIAVETIEDVILDDPDETTYCICQQISYGEMVCCENDACPIEWFHFSCVDLVSKPKGRWFCPQCRGDKPSVMNKNLRKKQQEANLL